MLVLTRNVGQEVVIGDTIVVRVVSNCRGVVKLGFDAPGLTIHRREIQDKVEAERREAGGKDGTTCPQ